MESSVGRRAGDDGNAFRKYWRIDAYRCWRYTTTLHPPWMTFVNTVAQASLSYRSGSDGPVDDEKEYSTSAGAGGGSCCWRSFVVSVSCGVFNPTGNSLFPRLHDLYLYCLGFYWRRRVDDDDNVIRASSLIRRIDRKRRVGSSLINSNTCYSGPYPSGPPIEDRSKISPAVYYFPAH